MHVPDRTFVKRMRRFQFADERLEVRWNRAFERWEIWRCPIFGTGRPCMLVRVQSPDGSYRPLDARTLLKLEERYRIHTSRSAAELHSELLDLERRAEELRRRDRFNAVDSVTADACDYMRGIFKISVPSSYGVKSAESGDPAAGDPADSGDNSAERCGQ